MKPVLIVEDETIMRESLRDWLKDEGYEVETAEAGEEALQRIGEKEFGVAVLDLRLPGRDGLEVLREAVAQNPTLKGIIITAYPSVETAVEAMKTGAVDYMVKPFTPDALEKSIEATLGPIQVEIKPKTAAEKGLAKVRAAGYVFIRLIDNISPQGCLDVRWKLENMEEVLHIDSVIDVNDFDMVAVVSAPKTVSEVAHKIERVPGIAFAKPSRIMLAPEF
ncbi:MAG: response regulator [Dehalococcoidia bacterium]|nr:response regulator [Dehalococcoidia bacterium]